MSREFSRTYSYSQLNVFKTCPRQYQAKYITKEVQFMGNAAAKWGSDVHSALEERIRDKTPLSNRFIQYEKYAVSIEKSPGNHEAEKPIAFDEDFNPVGWWDKSAFVRGKLDVYTDLGDRISIVDWKTSAKGAKNAQYQKGEMEFFAWLSFRLKPQVEKIRTALVWTETNDPPTVWFFDKQNNFQELEDKSMGLIQKVEDAISQDRFPMYSNPLCGWCDLLSCPNNSKR